MSGLESSAVWHLLRRNSFAVMAWTTPRGEPRSSAVVYAASTDRLFVSVAPGSWKARQIVTGSMVSLTVPVRRGGILSSLLPIPPSAVSLHGRAVHHPPGSARPKPLARLYRRMTLPKSVLATSAVLEIEPLGEFQTFGVGVTLWKLGEIAAAEQRVPVVQDSSESER